jgi:hypothetical protein
MQNGLTIIVATNPNRLLSFRPSEGARELICDLRLGRNRTATRSTGIREKIAVINRRKENKPESNRGLRVRRDNFAFCESRQRPFA